MHLEKKQAYYEANKDLYNQYVFKTEKALSFLKYTSSFEPGAAV